MVRVSEGEKELWVAAAHDERVSLSEWIRRCLNAGLSAGDDVPGAAVTGDAARDGEARRGVTPPRPRVQIPPSSSAESPEVRVSASGCPGFVPAGTRCKLCGQVHQQKGKRS